MEPHFCKHNIFEQIKIHVGVTAQQTVHEGHRVHQFSCMCLFNVLEKEGWRKEKIN